MPRVKRGVTAHRRHKRVLKQTKGYTGLRRRTIKKAREALLKAWTYQYRDRRNRKRDFRRLWITRIGAAARQHDLSYSQFMAGLKASGNTLNRKMLAEIAYRQPETFKSLVNQAKQGLKSAAKPAPDVKETSTTK